MICFYFEIELFLLLSFSFQHQSIPINEEIIDNSSGSLVETRRNSNRQTKRRTFRLAAVNVMKKKTRFESDLINNEPVQQNDLSPNGNEQQQPVGETKRLRTVGKRQGKRSSTQQGSLSSSSKSSSFIIYSTCLDNETEDYSSVIPLNSTLRQQLDEMFKDRRSRYNFLDLSKIELIY